MEIMGLIGFIVFVIGTFMIIWNTKEEVMSKAPLGIILITIAFFIGGLSIQNSYVKNFCEAEHISYELVETVAEYTNISETQAAHVFSAVDELMEPFEAIILLDDSLTEEDALAILTISDRKQAK